MSTNQGKSYRIPEPRIKAFAPPTYHCRRAGESFTLDGDLNKSVWQRAPWTADFRDIEGDGKPTPRFRTRAKMLWDDGALYVGAELEGSEIWGTVTKRDETIFVDNDFELFIDPDSDTHVYAEFEMNVLNTLWDLLLTKPYRDGGRAVSSYDIKGLEAAVLVDGNINDPTADNRKWSVEVKIPFKSLFECVGQGSVPKLGDFWRMNFSRVQWLVDVVDGKYAKRINGATGQPFPEDNWVWAPTGLINIHYPELWGFVFFCRGDEEYTIPPDEFLKWKLRRLYYALHAVFDETGVFAQDALRGTVEAAGVSIQTTDYGFTLSCPATDGKGRLVMYTDGRITYI
ncbi:hypothetical protein FACS1894142_2060 [Spirochaetia bacterium]|nr:hypothetical protein FACS1894142_2060 [Spirochaetia bacterium]